MVENSKGGPLGEMEDFYDFEDLGGCEWSRTLLFPSTIELQTCCAPAYCKGDVTTSWRIESLLNAPTSI
eukprot:SAG31_NODE_283_length_18512_cov_19.352414_16_plen_69_part_00